MKVEVRYMTDFGSERKIMNLNELTRFIQDHKIIALYEVKEEPEEPLINKIPK